MGQWSSGKYSTDYEDKDGEEEEEEVPTEVDNITKTIPPGFAPMTRYKKRRLNAPSPNTIMKDKDESSSE